MLALCPTAGAVMMGCKMAPWTRRQYRGVPGKRPSLSPQADLVFGSPQLTAQNTRGNLRLPAYTTSSCVQAWLRVALGYHTSEQVAAGAALGCAAAAAWRCLGAAVLPAVRQAPAAEKAAQALGMLALASFGVRTMAQEQGLLKRMYFLGRA